MIGQFLLFFLRLLFLTITFPPYTTNYTLPHFLISTLKLVKFLLFLKYIQIWLYLRKNYMQVFFTF